MSDNRYQCSSCGRSKRTTEFYSSRSPIYKHHGVLSICKKCMIDQVDTESVRSVINMLRMIDRPFIQSLWEASIEEAERHNRDNLFGIYMKNVVMQQFRDRTWDDSEFDDDIADRNISQSDEFSEEVLSRWRGWESDDIEILEEKYQDLIASYEDRTPIQRQIYRNIAIAQMQADSAIAEGKSADYKRFMDVISDLMHDGRIKPLQDTGEDDRGLNTWGEWIRKIEEEEPIPEPSEEFKDVDGIGRYIGKWFVNPMKKVMGISDGSHREDDG